MRKERKQREKGGCLHLHIGGEARAPHRAPHWPRSTVSTCLPELRLAAGLSHDRPVVRRKKWKPHDEKVFYKGRLCSCVRRVEVSEPSRQQKWVRIKQEVTRTLQEGRGGSGAGYLFLLFPTDLAGKCVRTQVGLVISWRISLIFFSSAFRQMAGNHSCWSPEGSGHHRVLEELSLPERAGGRGDCCCPVGPGPISGEPEACWVFCGCAWRVVSAR